MTERAEGPRAAAPVVAAVIRWIEGILGATHRSFMRIDLTPREIELVRRLCVRTLGELIAEVRRAERSAMKPELVEEEQVLRTLVEKLERTRSART